MITKSALLRVLALSLPLAFCSKEAVAQAADCDGAEIPFAHCAANTRNFHAVIVAVPGWNGDCASTFGKQARSLFNILQERFYDIDCFDYDSKKVHLDRNAQLLGERLVRLHTMGYRQAILLTHSTGGIVALRHFSQRFLRNGKLAAPGETEPLQTGRERDLRIKAIRAYAMPINGHWGNAAVVTLLQWSHGRETVADLQAGSDYLGRLKADLRQLRALMHGASTPDRTRLNLPVTFYHGQGKDWIVRDIDVAEAERAGWWPYGANFVHTATGHSQNVGEAGTVGAPQYPAEILAKDLLLELDLMPRLDEIFPKVPPLPSQATRKRQEIVVDGVAHYARSQQLQKAETVFIDFLQRLLTEAASSVGIAKRVIDKLRKSVEDGLLGNMTTQLTRFCDRVVAALRQYQTGRDVSIFLFGEASSDVAKAIAQLLHDIEAAVLKFRRENPQVAASDLFPSSGSLENFKAAVLSVQANILSSRYPDAQSAALEAIAKSLALYTAEEMTKAGFSDSINRYAFAKHRDFDGADRERVSRIYGAMLTKGPDLSDPTYAFLMQSVHFRSADRPLWVALMNNKTIEDVVFKRPPGAQINPQRLDFLTSVVRQTGATGNALATSRLALGEAFQMVYDAPTDAAKVEWKRKVIEAGQSSKYPQINIKAQQAARLD